MKPKIWRRRAEPEKKLHPESAELESEERVEGLGRGLWIQGTRTVGHKAHGFV